ncbi:MAG: hypothetical protein AAF829_01900 [Pseudomonadota bacterium]
MEIANLAGSLLAADESPDVYGDRIPYRESLMQLCFDPIKPAGCVIVGPKRFLTRCEGSGGRAHLIMETGP